ncbi:uncharacterized protein PRCAT00001219001 [Priceomyces carsonii]|uniref:uncharacterized protein n=1 Tax=Priceomyces carsonii TaxID=28549 RepID=UPI002EDA8A80|nr:unnamed protein product [Priceomyces carsonii]
MAIKLKIKAPQSEPSSNVGGTSTKDKKIKIRPLSKLSKNLNQKNARTKKLKINLPIGSGKRNESSKESSFGDNFADLQPTRIVPKVRVKPTRVPGEGYDSEAPDLEDDPLIESGIIIRFLNDPNLDFVHNALQSGDLTGLNIKWLTSEKALVHVNGTIYAGRLIDLPTITEFFKTIDKKNLFKSLDVCQILLILHLVNTKDLNMERDFEVPQDILNFHPLYKLSKGGLVPSRLTYKNGLLSPYEDVYRRFRARKVNHRVMNDIEAKVNELIRLDDEAEESRFELVDPNKEMQRFTSASRSPSVAADTISSLHEPVYFDEQAPGVNENLEVDLEADLEEELTRALENDEGEVDLENSEVLIQNEGSDLTIDERGQIEVLAEEVEADDDEEQNGEDEEEEDDDDEDEDDDDEDEEDDEDEDDESRSSKQHIKMLHEEISDLEKAVDVHKRGLESATHKMMRMKFQTSYNTLKASLDTKRRTLTKMLNDQEQLQRKINPTNNLEPQLKEPEIQEQDDDPDDDQEDMADDANDIDDLF